MDSENDYKLRKCGEDFKYCNGKCNNCNISTYTTRSETYTTDQTVTSVKSTFSPLIDKNNK